MSRRAVFSLPPRPAFEMLVLGADRLEAANAVIGRAVMGWNLPERVKRLALPLYRYGPADRAHLTLVAALDGDGRVLGVAAWEEAPPRDVPEGRRGLLLHGLYVDPPWQKQGVGRALFETALGAARRQDMQGVLVRAQADAAGFFARQGCQELPVVDHARDYPHRFWCPV